MGDVEERGKWITDSPRGEEMPIDCTYQFSFGKRIWNRDDLPEGWGVHFIEPGDERVAAFPTAKSNNPIGMPLAFLANPDGEMVATWDEGRWWTPDESGAWLLMLAAPGTFVLAEGMREAQMPRWWRRRKKPRCQR